MIHIRHYDGLVQARSAIRRAMVYTDDKKVLKKLKRLEAVIDRMVTKARDEKL